jgi:hypothetical protein
MNPTSLRCPTCRAEQPWSDICRRCKSDLRLLREVAAEYAAIRMLCLIKLNRNQVVAALEQARQCVALCADADSRRLLAVCELLNRNWPAALAQAEQLLAENDARLF